MLESPILGMKSIMYYFFCFAFFYKLLPKLIVMPWLFNPTYIPKFYWLKYRFFFFFFISKLFLLFICVVFYMFFILSSLVFDKFESEGSYKWLFIWSYWPLLLPVRDKVLVAFLFSLSFGLLDRDNPVFFSIILLDNWDTYLFVPSFYN